MPTQNKTLVIKDKPSQEKRKQFRDYLVLFLPMYFIISLMYMFVSYKCRTQKNDLINMK